MATDANGIDWDLVERNRVKLDAQIQSVVRHDVVETHTVKTDAFEKAFRETKARLEREESERAAASFQRFTDADNLARSKNTPRHDSGDVTYDQFGRAHGRALVEVVTPGGQLAKMWVSTGAVRTDAANGYENANAPDYMKRKRAEHDAIQFEKGTATGEWQASQRARTESEFRASQSAPTAGQAAPALPSEGRGDLPDYTDAEEELRRARASQRPATLGGGDSFTRLQLARSKAMFESH